MRTILITGGAGFIGSHVVDRCLEAGYRVIVVDNLSNGRRDNIPPGVEFHEVDINSPMFVTVLSNTLPDAIVHLAAQVSVMQSVKDAAFDAEVNVLGTVRILEAARVAGVGSLVFASSAAVYGTPESLPISEGHPLNPLTPYGVAKFTAERYIHAFSSLFGLRAVITRYANVYGPRQQPEGDGGVVAKFVSSMAVGHRPVLFGDGRQTRDFVYVKDVAEANCRALEYLFHAAKPEVVTVNISTSAPTSVASLHSALQLLMPNSAEPQFADARAGDIPHSCLDNSRARRVLGWAPHYNLEQGLREMMGLVLLDRGA